MLFGAAAVMMRRRNGGLPADPHRPPLWWLVLGEVMHLVHECRVELERFVRSPIDRRKPRWHRQT